jgi:DNA-binding MarR family transcriptional regulator
MTTDHAHVRPLDADEEALVRSLERVVHVLPRVIDATMMRERQISLTDYLTLSRLSEAPHRKMRMSELAQNSFMSLSGMSHVITRLEAEDLVSRVRDSEDRRGWHAVLTDKGLARLEEAWPSNLAGVRAYALDHLRGFDLRALAQAFEKFGRPAEG